MEKIKRGAVRVLPVIAAAAVCLALTPGVAAAYDFGKGAEDILKLVRTIIIIAVLVAGAIEFLKHQVTKTIVIIIIGALLIFLSNTDMMQNVGGAVMNLLGGTGSSGP
ncbi:TcpD family membrane protein [Desulfofundulus thermocisternus]|uniref:TcpD family membrane protein n=1 Tax=Desulfofundulus thermocisternus TaxID=42471 RepID=UPI00217CD96E|nr:TcpD family membrane protein [Desulfofundulus thermocisternus]MCS5697263.1 TcpD family membrane protein [Desulfofundulus thermocisternus]